MDRYRCKLKGYSDDFFTESYGGNNESETAVSWLTAFAHEYPETQNMDPGDTCIVVVETNGKTKTEIMIRATVQFFPDDCREIG